MASCEIKVSGLKESIKALKQIDSEAARELKRGIKEDARPILEDARGHAASLGGSGAYSASLSIRSTANGARIISSDPGAGVIEFANRGAVYLSGPRRGKPIGVPMGAPPRALVRASDDNRDLVVDSVTRRLDEMIERYLNG